MSKSAHGSFSYPVGYTTSNHMLFILPPASTDVLSFLFWDHLTFVRLRNVLGCKLDICLASRTCYQQKEPKLSRARQIPEWSQYDAKIARFARQLVKDGKIGSSALGAEVDALAGEKSTTPAEGVAVEKTVVGEEPVQAPHDEL
jgi:hypothetical protein